MHENPPSYGTALKEVGISAKELIQGELDLLIVELKETSRQVAKHSAEAALFGALMALSILPLLAFSVIGLGILLGERYWLSSLVVAGFCGLIGGIMAYRAYQKIKELGLPRTQRSVGHNREFVTEKFQEVKQAVRRRVG